MRRGLVFRCLLAAVAFGLWAAPAGAIGPTPPSWKPRETVTSTLANAAAHIGADRSLAYDHHGNAGIAFYDDVNDDLRYARSVPGVGWVHAAVDMSGFVGRYPSLAYDRYERPAISYVDGPNGDLKYARLNGSAWQVEFVDSAGDVGGSHRWRLICWVARPSPIGILRTAASNTFRTATATSVCWARRR